MDQENPAPTDHPSEDDLKDRLVRLEMKLEEERKSIQKKVATYAGLIALFISISTGSLSIYNAFFVAPELESKGHAQKLSAAIQDYNMRYAEASSLPATAPLEQRFAAANGLNNSRAALVAELRASDRETLSRLSAPDLSMSAWIIAESDEFELSQHLAEIAVQKAKGFPERTTALNTLSRTLLMYDEEKGRKSYDDLYKYILSESSVWRTSSYVAAASTETHVLAVTGRCERFSARAEHHNAALQGISADFQNREVFARSIDANKALCEQK